MKVCIHILWHLVENLRKLQFSVIAYLCGNVNYPIRRNVLINVKLYVVTA